jgi:iron complex outermembrane receptor protein
MRTRSFPVRSSILAQACLGVLTVASGSAPAVAQDSPLAASAGLEEIVVTARRREEALQDTPVAVSAFSGEALEIRGVKNIADVGQLVPNVQFDSVAPEAAGAGASALSIRGIGQSDYVITIEPGVGVYLDGVYISKSFGSLLDTIDVEQIEVLRGPQGTLFGKNTIGGAIVVTSRRPTAEPDFYAEVTTGEFNRFDFKGAVSGPLGDSFRARLSGAVQSTDGYVDRVTTGDTQGNIDRQAVRLVTEWDVTDDLLATLAVDGTRIREENAPIVVLTLSETAPFALYHNFVEYPACNPFIPGNDARFNNPDCYNSQYTSSLEDRKNYSNGPNYADSNVYGANLTLDWKADWGGLKSITAFRRVEVQSGQEVDNVPTFDGNIYQDYDTNQWSQEFQLSGKAWSDRLDYVVGAYYLNETGRQKFPIRTDFIEFTTGGEIDNDTFAIFGQASYQLTDALSLTAGVRWSEETKRFLPQQQIDYVPPQFQAPIPELGGAVLLPPVIPAAVGGQLSPFFQAGRPAAAERRGRDHRQPALTDGVARLQDHRRRAGSTARTRRASRAAASRCVRSADHPRRNHDRDRSREGDPVVRSRGSEAVRDRPQERVVRPQPAAEPGGVLHRLHRSAAHRTDRWLHTDRAECR